MLPSEFRFQVPPPAIWMEAVRASQGSGGARVRPMVGARLGTGPPTGLLPGTGGQPEQRGPGVCTQSPGCLTLLRKAFPTCTMRLPLQPGTPGLLQPNMFFLSRSSPAFLPPGPRFIQMIVCCGHSANASSELPWHSPWALTTGLCLVKSLIN